MSSATNYPNAQIVTITPTQRSTRTAARDEGRNLRSRKETRTETTTITSTIFEREPSETLHLATYSTATFSVATSFDWPSNALKETTAPHIHGIVPGAPRELCADMHSHSPPTSSLRTPTTIAAARSSSTTSPISRKSTYPRPSPPGFLYPSAIVPPASYLAQQQQQQQQQNPLQHPEHMQRAAGKPYHGSLLGRMDYEIAYMPPGLKVLFLVTLVVVTLASAWTILAWCVNFPPGTWSCWAHNRGGKKVKSKEKREDGEERRPVDKPSRYAGRYTVTASDTWMCSTGNNRATTSAIHTPLRYSSYIAPMNRNTTHNSNDAIELTHRPQHRRPRTQQDEQLRPRNQNTYTEHRRTSSSPSAGPRFSIGSSPTNTTCPTPTDPGIPSSTPLSTISSPLNPFLKPPNDYLSPHTYASNEMLKPRNSSEWLEERAAFFNSSNGNASPPPSLSSSSPASYPASPSSVSCLDTAAMYALEAGTAPLTGHPRSQSDEEKLGGGEEGMLKKSLSWLDQGLELMDGAVDKVVVRMARWTDDEGGDEGLVLPVAGC